MKILRLHHNPETATGNFRNYLDQDIALKPYSKIGLINCSIDLQDLIIEIDSSNNQFGWSGFVNSDLEVATLPDGNYSIKEFLQLMHYTLNTPGSIVKFPSSGIFYSIYNDSNYKITIVQQTLDKEYPEAYTNFSNNDKIVQSTIPADNTLQFKKVSATSEFNANFSSDLPICCSNSEQEFKFINISAGVAQFFVGITDKNLSTRTNNYTFNTLVGNSSPYLFAVGFAGVSSNNNFFIVDNIDGNGYVELTETFTDNDVFRIRLNYSNRLLTCQKNGTNIAEINDLEINIENLLIRRAGGFNQPSYLSGTIRTNGATISVNDFVPDPFYTSDGTYVTKAQEEHLINDVDASNIPGFQFNPSVNGSKLYNILGFTLGLESTIGTRAVSLGGTFNFLKANREAGYLIILNNVPIESFDAKENQQKRRNILAVLSKESVLIDSDKIDYEGNNILKVDLNNATDLNLNYLDVSILGSETDLPINCDKINLTLGIYDREE